MKSNEIISMNTLLNEFWTWAKCTPAEYADRGGEWEFDFPKFHDLIEYAFSLIGKEISDEEYDDLLMILALDNEVENVLDFLAYNCKGEQLKQIIARGMIYPQPNTRWQIAELLYRTRPEGYIEILQKLTNDPHPYVRKRAGNILNYLGE